jgi:hypothetical protein
MRAGCSRRRSTSTACGRVHGRGDEDDPAARGDGEGWTRGSCRTRRPTASSPDPEAPRRAGLHRRRGPEDLGLRAGADLGRGADRPRGDQRVQQARAGAPRSRRARRQRAVLHLHRAARPADGHGRHGPRQRRARAERIHGDRAAPRLARRRAWPGSRSSTWTSCTRLRRCSEVNSLHRHAAVATTGDASGIGRTEEAKNGRTSWSSEDFLPLFDSS